MYSQIPELLQSCSDLVQEDSDFKLVHEELNTAMNERIQKHVQQVLLPKFTGFKRFFSAMVRLFSNVSSGRFEPTPRDVNEAIPNSF
ncbi:hypothetical protein ACUN9W_03700 [Escherichia coli]